MRPASLLKTLFLAGAGSAVAAVAFGAEPGKPIETAGWQIKTFQIQPGNSWYLPLHGAPSPFPSPDPATTFADAQPLPLPSPDAPDEVWEQHIEKSSQHIARLIQSDGIEVPKGSLFLHDIASGTIVVRSAGGVLDLLEEMGQKAPHLVECTLDILQAETATIRQTVDATAAAPDHSAALAQLQALIAQGQAKSVRQLRLETRSGQRASTQTGSDLSIAAAVKLDAAGWIEYVRETGHVGTRLEVDPVIEPDGTTMDFNLDLKHHFAPPLRRHEFAGQAGALGRLEVPVTDFRCASIKTSTTLSSGMTQLLGVWTPEGLPEFANGRVMQAAFLSANVVPLLAEENKSLQGRMQKYIAKKGPPPVLANEQVDRLKHHNWTETAGMKVQAFKVPPDFFTFTCLGWLHAPVDPFAPADLSKGPSSLSRGCSIPEILKEHGIPWPEGAQAALTAQSSTLVVLNTPKNLERIHLLLEECRRRSSVKLLVHTLHIIEGDGTLIRQVTAQAKGQASHGAEWKQMEDLVTQGRLKLRSIARLEGRSGQRISCEFGTEHTSVSDPEDPAKAKDPAVPAADKTTPPQALKEVTYEMSLVGTRLEVDPVLDTDGTTVSVILSLEHHFAPATVFSPNAVSAPGTLRVDAPATDFHYGKVLTELTFSSGMTKLLALWHPTGSPVYEGKDIMQAVFLKVDVVTLERK